MSSTIATSSSFSYLKAVSWLSKRKKKAKLNPVIHWAERQMLESREDMTPRISGVHVSEIARV